MFHYPNEACFVTVFHQTNPPPAMLYPLHKNQLLTFVFLCLLGFPAFAQVPSITSFTPDNGPAGTIITISGSNFNTTPANNNVFFGAVKGQVITATATSLTVKVPAGASYAPFTVQNTANQLSGTSRSYFRTTFLSIHNLQSSYFDPPAVFASGPSNHSFLQQALVLEDFDNDGKVDVLTTNVSPASGGQGIYVFRNQTSAGTMNNTSFGTPQRLFPGDTMTVSVSLADLDGDGKKDIVAHNMNLQNKVIFRNTSTPGTISFASPTTLAFPANAWGIADIDGDGKPDMVGDGTNSALDSIFVLRNTSSTGSISFAAPVFTGQLMFPYVANTRLSFYDMDGDGKQDILYPGVFFGPVTISKWSAIIHRNQSTPGNISFSGRQQLDSIGGASACMRLSIADFDGDGKPDIAGATSFDYNVPSNANKMIVWRNTSTGTGNLSFQNGVIYNTDVYPYFITAEDFDGDGKADIALVNGNTATINIFRNTAVAGNINASSFTAPVTLGVAYPVQLAAGDVDGDGKPDIVSLSANNALAILRNNPPPVIKNDKNSFCKGDSTKLYIISEKAGISAYQWEVNTGSGFTSITNGSLYGGATTDTLHIYNMTSAMHGYKYRLKDVNNAQNKISWNTDTLKVYDPPAAPVITFSNGVLGTTLTYTTYQWYLNNAPIAGATSATYIPTQNGSYTLQVTNGGECYNFSSPKIITNVSVTTATGNSGMISIYPNPAVDEVKIDAPFAVNITIADVTGRVVISRLQTNTVSLAGLAGGVYLFRIMNKDGQVVKTEKVVKRAF